MPLILFFLFVAVPIVEIAVLIEVGGLIGLWPTLAIVVLTAFAGTVLLRAQGLATFARAQRNLAEGRLPMREVMHGFFLIIAGVLLLTPGLLTDALGFCLFIPAVRDGLGRVLGRWVTTHSDVHVFTDGVGPRDRSPPDRPIIDLEADKPEDNPPPPSDPSRSPWRS